MALADVIGQGKALKILRGAMGRGRVASSYLFAGEQGIGKKLAAINFAKALNCHNPVASGEKGIIDSCDACPSCKKIDSGAHPDFMLIEPDRGMIKIGQIKRSETSRDEDGKPFFSIEEMLSLKAREARVRVIVLDDADRMNSEAANAFLKTLEEPPDGSLIILVSESPDMLPETIRSRCSRVNFSPLSPAEAEAVIKKGSPLLVQLCMGRPGLAKGEDLLKERDRFIDSLGRAEGGGKHPWKEKKDMERWFDMALLIIRDIAVMKITGNADALINKDKSGALGGIADKAGIKGIMDCYKKLLVLRRLLGFNLNRGITWNYAIEAMREAELLPEAQA